jgi:hypothetical protein
MHPRADRERTSEVSSIHTVPYLILVHPTPSRSSPPDHPLAYRVTSLDPPPPSPFASPTFTPLSIARLSHPICESTTDKHPLPTSPRRSSTQRPTDLLTTSPPSFLSRHLAPHPHSHPTHTTHPTPIPHDGMAGPPTPSITRFDPALTRRDVT